MIDRLLYRARPLDRSAERLLAEERSLEPLPSNMKERVLQRTLLALRTDSGIRERVPGATHAHREERAERDSGIFRAVRAGWFGHVRPAYIAAAILVGTGVSAAAIGYTEYRGFSPWKLLGSDTPEIGSSMSAPSGRNQVKQGEFAAKTEPTTEAEAEPKLSVVDANDLPLLVAKTAARTNRVEAVEPKQERFEEERSLLEPARSAVARSDHAGALSAIAHYRAQFPNGQLAQEAEALRVRALWGLGRHAEARQAASDFKLRYPRSVLLAWMQQEVRPE
jgi:hypothetical protein